VSAVCSAGLPTGCSVDLPVHALRVLERTSRISAGRETRATAEQELGATVVPGCTIRLAVEDPEEGEGKMNHALLLAVGIGIVAGLRSLTAPALVAWAAHLGWLNLQGTPISWMGSAVAVGVFTLLAIVELIGDVLPKTPPRTGAMGLSARIVMGGFTGLCLYAAAQARPPVMGIVFGIIGVLIGTYGGYHARRALVNGLKVKDILIAIPEDVVAIALGYWIVR